MQNVQSISFHTPLSVSDVRTQPRSFFSFIPHNFSTVNTRVWDRIKNTFSPSTPITPLLSISTEQLKQKWPEYKPVIEDALFSLMEKKERKLFNELKILLNKMLTSAPNHVQEVINDVLQRAVISDQPNRSVLCLDLMGTKALLELAVLNGYIAKDAKSLSAQMARDLPPLPAKHWMRAAIESEIKRQGFIILNFFTNLLDTVIRALSFYDHGKWPNTFWEYNTLLDIYLKVFLIPYVLYVSLSPILLAAAKTYVVTAGLIGAIGIGLYAYTKFIRPKFPNIPWVHDLSKKAERGELNRVFEVQQNVDRIIRHLRQPPQTASRHLLLVGPTGAGKTSLIQAAAQRIALAKKDPDAPKDLKEIQIKEVNTSQFANGDWNNGFVQKLIDLHNHLKICTVKPFIFFDEFADAFKNQEFGKALIAELDSGQIRCLAAMTEMEWNEVKTKDPSLKDRFNVVQIPHPDEELTTTIVKEVFSKNAPDTPITDEAYEIVVKQAMQKFSQTHGSPLRYAKDLLNQLVSSYQTAWKQPYNPHLLEKEKARLEQLKDKYRRRSIEVSMWENTIEAAKIDDEISKTQQLINGFTLILKERQKKFSHLEKLKKMKMQTIQAKEEIARLIDQWSLRKKAIPERLEQAIIFYQYLLIPALQRQFNKECDEVKLPKQIDKEFVEAFLKTL